MERGETEPCCVRRCEHTHQVEIKIKNNFVAVVCRCRTGQVGGYVFWGSVKQFKKYVEERVHSCVVNFISILLYEAHLPSTALFAGTFLFYFFLYFLERINGYAPNPIY